MFAGFCRWIIYILSKHIWKALKLLKTSQIWFSSFLGHGNFRSIQLLFFSEQYCGLTEQAAKHHTVIWSSPPRVMEEKTGKKGKTCGLRQFNSTENEGKITIRIKDYTKQVMHSAITHYPLSDTQQVSKQWKPPPQPNSPVLLFSVMVWNPSASLGQMSWLCCLPVSCTSPVYLLPGQHENPKSPWSGVSTSQQQLSVLWVLFSSYI